MLDRVDDKQGSIIRRFKSLWGLNILSAVCAGIILTAIAILFFFADSYSRRHLQLTQTIYQVEVNATAAHLWFEEAVTGDPYVRIDDVREHLLHAEQAIETIMTNGVLSQESRGGPELLLKLIQIKEDLGRLRAMTEQRWQAIQQSGPGSPIDKDYDEVYDQVVLQTNAIYDELDRKIASDSSVFRRLAGTLFVISFLTLVINVLFANYYLNRQSKDKEQLIAINQQLRATEQQLRAANQQLTANEAELKSLAKFPSEDPHPVLRIQLDGTVIYRNQASGPLLEHWNGGLGQKLSEPWRNIISHASAKEKVLHSIIDCENISYALTVTPVPEMPYVNIYATDITLRRQALKKLREKDAMLRATSQLGKIGGWELDLQTHDVTWTDEVVRIFDSDPGAVTNLESALSYYTEASRVMLTAAIKDAVDKGSPYDLELELITAKGQHKWVRSVSRLVFKDGRCVKLRGMIQDITIQKHHQLQLQASLQQLKANEQQLKAADQLLRASEAQLKAYNEQLKNANEKLSDSEKRFRLLMEQSPSVIEMYDRDGLQIAVNKAYEELWGFPAEHTLHQYNIFQSDEIKRLGGIKYIERAYAGETVTIGEYEFDPTGPTEGRGLGRKRWLHTHIYPIKDSRGNVENIVISHEDITDRKASETKYRSLFENMLSGFALHEVIVDANGEPVDCIYLEVNKAFERLLGLRRDEVVGKPVCQMLPGIKSTFGEKLLRLGQAGCEEEFRFEEYFESLGKWLSVNAYSPQKGQFATIFEDITERKQAEEAVQKNETRFRLIYEQLPLAYQSLDEAGRFLEVNPKWLSMMGYDKQEVIGRSFVEFIPKRYHAFMRERFQCFKDAGRVRSVEFQLIRKNGALIDVELDGEIGRNPDGSFKQTHCILNDVTERRKAQQEHEQLMRKLQSKNEELQSIVYVASHDLKSPLVNISGFGTLLLQHCEQLNADLPADGTDTAVKQLVDEEITEDVEFILESADKMNALIDGLLEVSRAGMVTLHLRPLDMNAVIQAIIKNVSFKIQQMEAQITVDRLAPCMGDLEQISRIFTNLVENALKYADPSRKPLIHISCTVGSTDNVYCVEDNGIGIDPAYHEKIFEVFHRLNPHHPMGGEGLGLTIIRRILDRHNGRIWVDSTPGKGSRFFVALPNQEAL